MRDTNRRQFLVIGVGALLLLTGRGTRADEKYSTTIAVLQQAHDREMGFYHRYVAFSHKAKLDGYRGIAYMFTAFAASELIHAQNFDKILARLGIEIAPSAKPQVPLGTTRENLIQAVSGELEDINSFYPDTLNRLKPETHDDAIAMTGYAWESEKQHRAIMKDIQRWSGSHFEQVAKTIDEKTGLYFICQVCGSTQIQIPKGKCPICKFPPEHYRKIEIPA